MVTCSTSTPSNDLIGYAVSFWIVADMIFALYHATACEYYCTDSGSFSDKIWLPQ
jgi:hypothetical protein